MLFICLLLQLFLFTANGQRAANTGPIIGIVAQDYWLDADKAFIAASYVKWIESAGGRVVPILKSKSDSYYESLLNNLNGVLFPGIDPNYDQGRALRQSSKDLKGMAPEYSVIFKMAKKLNNRGDYFPVWGTCLGMEMMMREESKSGDPLTHCEAYNLAAPLQFVSTPSSWMQKPGRLFKSIHNDLFYSMSTRNVTIHFHRFCLTEESFKSSLKDKYRVLAFNHDKENKKFVSIVEGIDKPFYGVQFHPEKPIFEFIDDKNHENIPHTYDSVQAGQYFANFFVNQSRQSRHTFSNNLKHLLIYNFKPEYTGDTEFYEQMYFFN